MCNMRFSLKSSWPRSATGLFPREAVQVTALRPNISKHTRSPFQPMDCDESWSEAINYNEWNWRNLWNIESAESKGWEKARLQEVHILDHFGSNAKKKTAGFTSMPSLKGSVFPSRAHEELIRYECPTRQISEILRRACNHSTWLSSCNFYPSKQLRLLDFYLGPAVRICFLASRGHSIPSEVISNSYHILSAGPCIPTQCCT